MREVYEITVSDGTRFLCEINAFGGVKVPVTLRWSISTEQTLYVGPPTGFERTPEEVAAAIDAWWEGTKQADYRPEWDRRGQ